MFDIKVSRERFESIRGAACSRGTLMSNTDRSAPLNVYLGVSYILKSFATDNIQFRALLHSFLWYPQIVVGCLEILSNWNIGIKFLKGFESKFNCTNVAKNKKQANNNNKKKTLNFPN